MRCFALHILNTQEERYLTVFVYNKRGFDLQCEQMPIQHAVGLPMCLLNTMSGFRVTDQLSNSDTDNENFTSQKTICNQLLTRFRFR